jgi:hypothetical protein
MVGYNDSRRTIDWYILKSQNVFLLEIQSGVHKLEISTECLQKQRVFSRMSLFHIRSGLAKFPRRVTAGKANIQKSMKIPTA